MPTRAYRRDRKAFRGASLAIADEKRCEVTADWPERFKYILIIVNIYVMTILVPLGFFARVPSLATETPANSPLAGVFLLTGRRSPRTSRNAQMEARAFAV